MHVKVPGSRKRFHQAAPCRAGQLQGQIGGAGDLAFCCRVHRDKFSDIEIADLHVGRKPHGILRAVGARRKLQRASVGLHLRGPHFHAVCEYADLHQAVIRGIGSKADALGGDFAFGDEFARAA